MSDSSRLTGQTDHDTIDSRSIRSRAWIPLAIFHFAVCIYLAFFLPEPGPGVGAIVLAPIIAILASYLSVCGYYLALRKNSVIAWLSLTSGLLLIAIAVWGCYVARTGGPASVIYLMLAGFIIQWLLALAPGLVMSRMGWSLSFAKSKSNDQTGFSNQFHLRHLFYWTTGIAVLFSATRLALHLVRAQLENMNGQTVSFGIFFSILIIGHAMMTGPILWMALSRRLQLHWSAVSLFALLALGVTGYLFLRETQVTSKMSINAIHFTIVGALAFELAVLSIAFTGRWMGWALVHRPAST